MGAVFRATHATSGRPVAIKWMLPGATADKSAIERFFAEARTMARIEHPNVVSVLDMGEDHGAPFLVMELLRGESLRQRLARRGRLGVAEAVDTLLPAMRGVAEAHREGIVHRDLKPDNIFLCQTKDGRPREAKVVDFGISKLAEHTHESGPVTKTGMAIGTPTYMSPEQLNAPKVADPRFDVYAMGVVLYECLAGYAPYNAEGLLALISQIAAGNAAPPSASTPDVSPALDRIVATAMHVSAEQRFRTMHHFIEALQEVRSTLLPTCDPANGGRRSGTVLRIATLPELVAPHAAATRLPAGSGHGAPHAGAGPRPQPVPPHAEPRPLLRASASHATTPLPSATPLSRPVSAQPNEAARPCAQPNEAAQTCATAQGYATPPSIIATVNSPTPEPVATKVAWFTVGLVVLATGAAFGVGWLLLGHDEPKPAAHEPSMQVARSAAASTTQAGSPASAAVASSAAPPSERAEFAPLTYAEVAADVARHEGEPLSVTGVVAHCAQGDDESFLVFVATEACGGSTACGAHVSGAPLVPPEGQAVRIDGRVEGDHRYRTRGGADRRVPHLRAERVEFLSEFHASPFDRSELPAERAYRRAAIPWPRALPTPTPLAPSPAAPQPRAHRPVISADEI